jgi:hypothetical protein
MLFNRTTKENFNMPYIQNPRDCESPLAAEAVFYKERIARWLKYKRDVFNSYIDDNPKKPCLVLGCGSKDIPLDTQTVLLLREALKKEPKLLDDYLDGWLVANADDFIAMSSSGSMKPKRRLGSKPKSTFINPNTAKLANCNQQVVDNISDAINSALV